jgi:hypothetical protein
LCPFLNWIVFLQLRTSLNIFEYHSLIWYVLYKDFLLAFHFHNNVFCRAGFNILVKFNIFFHGFYFWYHSEEVIRTLRIKYFLLCHLLEALYFCARNLV